MDKILIFWIRQWHVPQIQIGWQPKQIKIFSSVRRIFETAFRTLDMCWRTIVSFAKQRWMPLNNRWSFNSAHFVVLSSRQCNTQAQKVHKMVQPKSFTRRFLLIVTFNSASPSNFSLRRAKLRPTSVTFCKMSYLSKPAPCFKSQMLNTSRANFT